jgi:hypothetical protein
MGQMAFFPLRRKTFLWIFITIHCPQPGLNPLALGPIASTLTIRSHRALLKPKFVCIVFKNLDTTSKRTLHFTTTNIDWFRLFKEIIAVYSENHTKPINTKHIVTDC